MDKYAIEIFYSEEDNGYIAIIPELETAKKEGRKIPQPHGKELLKILYEDAFRTTRPKQVGV
jgi:predicted RNase H-like HicB family nuclease